MRPKVGENFAGRRSGSKDPKADGGGAAQGTVIKMFSYLKSAISPFLEYNYGCATALAINVGER